MSQLCQQQYVNNFMNVAERDSFDLQVPEVSCM